MPFGWTGYNQTQNNPRGIDWSNPLNYLTYNPEIDQQILANAPDEAKARLREFFGSEQYRARVNQTQNQSSILGRINQLSDPTSDYYRNINQMVSDNLTNVYNPNSLLAVARATGLSGQGSATVANMQQEGIRRGISETANQAVNQAYTNSGNMINGLLGMYSQNNQFRIGQEDATRLTAQQMAWERQRYADENSPWNQVLGLLGYAGGQYAGAYGAGSGAAGGGSAGITATMPPPL